MEKDISPLSTRIFLVRHGETEWNRIRRFQGRSDIPLSREGKEQADSLALVLKDESLTAIYSSPLVRAVETARIIKTFHPSTPLLEEPGLVEMDLGEFDGMEAPHWAERYPDFLKAWWENPADLRMPGGENLKEVQTRAMEALDRISQSHPVESTLLICGHNFVNLTILCHAMEISLNRFRDLRQETASLNVLSKQGGKLRAEVINERSHLKKKRGARIKVTDQSTE